MTMAKQIIIWVKNNYTIPRNIIIISLLTLSAMANLVKYVLQ